MKIDLFLSEENLKEIIEKLGYKIDETGVIIDRETNKPVKSEISKEEINIKKDRGIAIVSGSHIFIKNIAEFSHLLTEKKMLKIKEKQV